MRKAKEKNKPLLSLAAAGLAALLLFGMATAVLAQGTQGKFVADEWSGIAEADIAEGDSTKDQAENQASTTPTPTPVSTQDESTALSDATPESAESSELTENKETDSDSNAEIPAEVSAFSNDLAVEEVSLYDASGTSAQDAVTSWTELKSAVASAARRYDLSFRRDHHPTGRGAVRQQKSASGRHRECPIHQHRRRGQ